MDPSQELLATTTSLDALIQYVHTHSLYTILIAIGVLLSPFIVKALLQLIWRLFMVLAQFFFKDQINTFMQKKITALLQRYVDKQLVVTETPFYQSNMVTLYGLQWVCDNIKVNVNRAEIRVDLGQTIRKYIKLWLKHLFKKFDYRTEQKTLLCTCIKDVRFSRSDIEIILPTPDPDVDQTKMLMEGAQENLQGAMINIEALRNLRLNIGFENGEVLLKAGREEFRLQNFFGMIQNVPNFEGSKCSVRFGCIYDGENISLNSLDDNLTEFAIVATDIYFSDKIWHTACDYCSYLPRNVKITDGKLLDIRAKLVYRDGRFCVDSLAAKMDEAQFSCGMWQVDDLEISLVSRGWQIFEIKKASARVNNVFVSLKGNLSLQNNILSSEKLDLKYGNNVVTLIKPWGDLRTKDWGCESKIVHDIDVKNLVNLAKETIGKKLVNKFKVWKDKVATITTLTK